MKDAVALSYESVTRTTAFAAVWMAGGAFSMSSNEGSDTEGPAFEEQAQRRVAKRVGVPGRIDVRVSFGVRVGVYPGAAKTPRELV
jgi:hypothetical protein